MTIELRDLERIGLEKLLRLRSLTVPGDDGRDDPPLDERSCFICHFGREDKDLRLLLHVLRGDTGALVWGRVGRGRMC